MNRLLLLVFLLGCAGGERYVKIEAKNVIIESGMLNRYIPSIRADELLFESTTIFYKKEKNNGGENE